MTHWAARAQSEIETATDAIEDATKAGTAIVRSTNREAAIAALLRALSHLESWRAVERREREHSPEQVQRLERELKRSVR